MKDSEKKEKKSTFTSIDNDGARSEDYIRGGAIENNIFLEKFFPEKKGTLHLSELAEKLELAHGRYLAHLIEKEWEIHTVRETVDRWEYEHGNDLAFMVKLEAQRMQLAELIKQLERTATIHEKDLKMAAQVQKSLLFSKPPDTTDYDIAIHFRPLASVSGDFYDIYLDKNNNLYGIALGDVSGHGIASSLFTVLAKPLFFRAFISNATRNLGEIIAMINKRLIKQMDASDYYLTAILLRFKDDIVEYSNACHPDLIFCEWKPEGYDARVLSDVVNKGSFLGVADFNLPFDAVELPMKSNDLIILYTDCLTETKNGDGEEFGEERVIEIVRNMKTSASSGEILKEIIGSLNRFTKNDPLRDDLTILIVRKKNKA